MTRAKPWDPNEVTEAPAMSKPWNGWIPPTPEEAERGRTEYEAHYQANAERYEELNRRAESRALPWE